MEEKEYQMAFGFGNEAEKEEEAKNINNVIEKMNLFSFSSHRYEKLGANDNIVSLTELY